MTKVTIKPTDPKYKKIIDGKAYRCEGVFTNVREAKALIIKLRKQPWSVRAYTSGKLHYVYVGLF